MIRPGYLSKASISIDGEFPCGSGSKLKRPDGSGRCGVEFGIGGGVMVLVGFYFFFIERDERKRARRLRRNSRAADHRGEIEREFWESR